MNRTMKKAVQEKPLSSSFSTLSKSITIEDIPTLRERLSAKTTVLLLHANWCGHCQLLKPIWTKAITTALNTQGVDEHVNFMDMEENVLSEINNRDQDLFAYVASSAKSKDVYFPKIMIFTKTKTGTRRSAYEGSRQEDKLVSLFTSKASSK